MKHSTILIADDNKGVLDSLKLFLEDDFNEVVTISNPNLIPSHISHSFFDVYLLDMNFTGKQQSGNEGLFWMQKIKEHDPEAVIVFITAYGDVNLAVKAVKQGAFDFIVKPWDNNKLLTTLKAAQKFRLSKEALRKAVDKEKVLKKDLGEQFPLIKGKSESMDRIYQIMDKVAPTDADILILGENGTGKEVIAREIHRLSYRKDEIFLSADISSLSEGILESELFGHKKGAFTDAQSDRTGKFEAASGGTLFLDEIGNLSLPQQAKLLTVLQNREIIPVGSNKAIPFDIRLICATNSKLEQMISDGSFREDLFFRINTVTINLPPLRERKDDILPLSEYFLRYFAKKYAREGVRLEKKIIGKLISYPWKGNIRELRHAIEKAIILADSKILTENDFRLYTFQENSLSIDGLQPLADLEKAAIAKAIGVHKGNLTKIAHSLQITRQTLYNKIKKYDL